MSTPINVPEDRNHFRKWIKAVTCDEIKVLNKQQLQVIYERAKDTYPAKGKPLSRNERIILYTIQEKLFGSVDAKLISSLENIGETLVKKPDKRKKTVDYQLPTEGAVIVKQWKGKKLEVKIVPSGFEYEGRIYQSLSRLAKQNEGYAVSGPIFFGLRNTKARIAV